MRGFASFLYKELLEIVRTWRIWVLPGMALFFAAMGPAMAKFTPMMLESLGPGVVIKIPIPTYVDAYAQWIKNLSQIMTFAALIAFGGAVSAEVRSGTAALVLTKPVSRAAFVLAKAVGAAALLTGSVVAGTIVTWGFTWFVFGEAPLRGLPEASLAWLAWMLLLTAFVLLLSASFDSWAGASGGGLALYAVLAVMAMWGPGVRYTPAGLIAATNDLLAGKDVSLLGPVLITVGLAVAFVAAGAVVFSRREL